MTHETKKLGTIFLIISLFAVAFIWFYSKVKPEELACDDCLEVTELETPYIPPEVDLDVPAAKYK